MSDFVKLGHGLYRPVEAVQELSDRCGAYLDAMPSDTVVGGLTAARLHGMWLPQPRLDERIELVTARPESRPHELARCRRREIRPRRRTLRPHEIVVTDRFALTSIARTWVDLAETLSLEDLVAAGDSALRGSVDHGDLTRAVQEAFRRRGVLRARRALELLDERSRSRPESHLRCAVVLGGLPWPDVNQAIYTDRGEWLAEPDLSYRGARLALEYNGRDHAEVDQFRKDITREIDIDGNDWKVIVFGPAQVFGHPYRIAPYVRAQLDQRDPGWWRRAG